eukprot:gnl/TRDRNA2_/TRDRNA2_176860_c6_seq1.p1 gnl/TRDRNA2_/TRDRNA2_176860_c6~~gnl/TRDRNA2_/TRDRNA2_176860_c6_seq1.p1  ORF type:complete len:571 (-),score=150.23 gnl/TRDRNA2_/TRDRNA2_176860_c6_seq1:378-2009(-)
MALSAYRPSTSFSAQQGLASLEQEASPDTFIDGLRDPDKSVRISNLQQMAKHGPIVAEYTGWAGSAAEMLSDDEPTVICAALTALGAMGAAGAAFASDIAMKLSHEDDKVKQTAAKSLGSLGEFASSQSSAIEALLSEKNLDLVAAACESLGKMKSTGSAKTLAKQLDNKDSDVVCGAVCGLGYLDMEVDAVGKTLGSKSALVKTKALEALSMMSGSEKFVKEAAKLLGDSDCYVRLAAVKLFAKTEVAAKASAEAKTIGALLSNSDAGIKAAAATALGSIGADAASQAEAVAGLLKDTSEDDSSVMMSIAGMHRRVAAGLRKPACAAACALCSMGALDDKLVSAVCDGLNSNDPEVRAACAESLGVMGTNAAKYDDRLLGMLDDPVPTVVAASLAALANMPQMGSTAEKISEFLESKHPIIRVAALQGLAGQGAEATPFLEAIVKSFGDSVSAVKAAAVPAVVACGEIGQMYAADICRLIFEDETSVRIAALEALTKLGARGAAFEEEVSSLLDDESAEVRACAEETLRKFANQVSGAITDA